MKEQRLTGHAHMFAKRKRTFKARYFTYDVGFFTL